MSSFSMVTFATNMSAVALANLNFKRLCASGTLNLALIAGQL